MLTARDLWTLSRDELEGVLARGYAVTPIDLADHAYFGVSLGLPAVIERLTWKTFAKVFIAEADGTVSGLNVRLEQRGVDGELLPRRDRAGAPVTFGPFAVHRSAPGVLLDYGARAAWWQPLGRLRDPLVAVNEGSTDLLLGTSRLAVAGRQLATPSWFTLERRARWPLP